MAKAKESTSAQPVGVWWGGYSINVACKGCGHYTAARQRKSDGRWRHPSHKKYGRGEPKPCTKLDVSTDAVRAEYAAAVKRELPRRFNAHWITPSDRGRIALDALDSKHNDTPGLDDLRVLFELFRDVLEFMLSDQLWRAVAAQEAAELPVLVWVETSATTCRGELLGAEWQLFARGDAWSIRLSAAAVSDGANAGAGVDTNMRAAERALRKHGVAFRVHEG